MESWELGRIRFIPVRAHVTLLVAVPYFVFLVASQVGQLGELAGINPLSTHLPALAWGVALGAMLVVSVLLHELTHALVARQLGKRVHALTLTFVGGFTQVEALQPGARDRALAESGLALSGTITSFVLSAVAYALYRRAAGVDARFALYYAWQINLTIALFNLLPAFPLDGGRLLRALLAHALGPARGTRVAVYVGQLAAVVLLGLGAMGFNLILMLVAIFMLAAGARELQLVAQRQSLEGLRARDIMHRPRLRLEAKVSVAEALVAVGATRLGADPAVAVAHGRLVGVADAAVLRRIPQGRREVVPLGLAAEHDVPVLNDDAPAAQAAELLSTEPASAAHPVVAVVDSSGELEGLIGPEDLEAA